MCICQCLFVTVLDLSSHNCNSLNSIPFDPTSSRATTSLLFRSRNITVDTSLIKSLRCMSVKNNIKYILSLPKSHHICVYLSVTLNIRSKIQYLMYPFPSQITPHLCLSVRHSQYKGTFLVFCLLIISRNHHESKVWHLEHLSQSK